MLLPSRTAVLACRRIDWLSIEYSGSCDWDALEFFDVPPDGADAPFELSSARPLGVFCGSSSSPSVARAARNARLVSRTNRLLVRFRSDSSVAGDGFALTYFATLGTFTPLHSHEAQYTYSNRESIEHYQVQV